MLAEANGKVPPGRYYLNLALTPIELRYLTQKNKILVAYRPDTDLSLLFAWKVEYATPWDEEDRLHGHFRK